MAKTSPPDKANKANTGEKSFWEKSHAEQEAVLMEGATLLPRAKQARDAAERTARERAEREQQNRVMGGRAPAERPIPALRQMVASPGGTHGP